MTKSKILAGILGIVMTASLFSGCITKETIIPEEVITKAVSAYEKPESYYGEFKMEIYENNKLTESYNFKEWVDNSGDIIKRRSETESSETGKIITTNDGNNVIIYTEKDKTATSIKVTDDFGNTNYKERIMEELGYIAKTHQISVKGEEVVNGFNTYHLHAVPKENNSLVGTVDYWIDNDSWLVVKNSSEIADTKCIMEYTKVDFSPSLDSSLFVQNLPEDVKITNLDDSTSSNSETIDLQKAVEIAGKPILQLPDNSGYNLKAITHLNFEKIQHEEITQSYEKDGLNAIELSIIISDASDNTNLLPQEKEISVRGKKASVLDMGDGTIIISWKEDGFNYCLLFDIPEFNVDEAIKIAESLNY